jgi:hypothetical protein
MGSALIAAEIALAALIGWFLVRSDFALRVSDSTQLGAGAVFILAAMLTCLALVVFVLAWWQRRLSGAGRVRVFLAAHLSLVVCFCGFCWHDVAVASATVPQGVVLDSPAAVLERTVAAGLTMGSLLAGLAAITVVLCLERRVLKRRG